MQFVPECKMTQEMCDKGVNRCFLVFSIIPDWYRTWEICDSVASENAFLIVMNIKLKGCVMKLLIIVLLVTKQVKWLRNLIMVPANDDIHF